MKRCIAIFLTLAALLPLALSGTATEAAPEAAPALTPPALWEAASADAVAAYAALGAEYGYSLAPVTAWAKALGLAEPRLSKGVLTFSAARNAPNALGEAKKVAIEGLTWVHEKEKLLTPESLPVLFAALSEAWTGEGAAAAEGEAPAPAPAALAEAFAVDPAAAYLSLSEAYGLPLAPVLAWAEAQGLIRPKAAREALGFTVDKAFSHEWGGAKKIEAEAAWVNQKALAIAPADFPALLSALAGQWTPPPPSPLEMRALLGGFYELEALRLLGYALPEELAAVADTREISYAVLKAKAGLGLPMEDEVEAAYLAFMDGPLPFQPLSVFAQYWGAKPKEGRGGSFAWALADKKDARWDAEKLSATQWPEGLLLDGRKLSDPEAAMSGGNILWNLSVLADACVGE